MPFGPISVVGEEPAVLNTLSISQVKSWVLRVVLLAPLTPSNVANVVSYLFVCIVVPEAGVAVVMLGSTFRRLIVSL